VGFATRRRASRRDFRERSTHPTDKINLSHHAVLEIGDPPVEAAAAGLAVEAHGEVAEGVGGVRGPVVHRMRPQHVAQMEHSDIQEPRPVFRLAPQPVAAAVSFT